MKTYKTNPRLKTGYIATMLSCLLLSSCSSDDFFEDDNSGQSSDYICFGMVPDKNTRGGSRAGEGEARTVDRFVLRSANSNDTLCVRTIVSEGIHSADVPGEQAITRGAPVTKDNFYKNFHVQAYWEKDGALVTKQFYMNEDVTKKDNGFWSGSQVYYWPGANHSLQFYAWAPADLDPTYFSGPKNPDSKMLSYSVPAEAAKQKDIVVASTDKLSGDYGKVVPLTFKHVCTAVRFVVGSQMQQGTIQSVALKGVRNKGSYNMETASWALDGSSTYNFQQAIGLATTTTSAASGSAITSAEGTFMMLPQTLPEGATVEVVFKENISGNTRTLSASISGSEWKMGTTVTYKLSITPEFELEFTKDNPSVVDAHYLIVPITVNAKDMPSSGYTLTSTNTAICKLRASLIGPEAQGYWPKESTADGDFQRKNSITATGDGSKTFYAFITENATNSDRNITLQLSCYGKVIQTLTIAQKCPNWIGNAGWEHVEEDGEKPFGFAWNRKVLYTPNGELERAILWFIRLLGRFSNTPAIHFNTGLLGYIYDVTIDYSQVPAITGVFDSENGLSNTIGFNSNVASSLSSLENTLGRYCTITNETGDNINSTDFAALACIKKNACNIEKKSQNGEIVYMPSFDAADIKWYLPARNQFSDQVGLAGQYWTSTAINNNTQAYSWNGTSQATPRMENHKVRAARVKE